MHCKTLFTLGFLVMATLAQDSGLITTLVTLISTICDCDISTTSDHASPTSPPAVSSKVLLQGSSSTNYSLTNMTTSLSNLSTTVVSISPSNATSAVYANTTISSNAASSATSLLDSNAGIPTSIIFATGTPVVPTVTSFTVITPTRTVTTTSPTASLGAANMGISVAYSGMAMVLLSLSSLLFS